MIIRVEGQDNIDNEIFRTTISRLSIIAPTLQWFYNEDEDGNVINDKLSDFQALKDFYTPEFINRLKIVKENVDQISAVDSNIDNINLLSRHIKDIEWINDNKSKIDNFIDKVKSFEEKYVDAKVMTCRIVDFSQRALGYKQAIESLYIHDIKPNVEKAELLVDELKTQLTESVEAIENGHEWARRIYDSRIVVKPVLTNIESVNCTTYKDPEYFPDGTLKNTGTITFCVPRPICNVTATDIPTSLVQSAVDDYIKTLSINTDQPITQVRVNEAFDIPRALTRAELSALIYEYMMDKDNVEKQNAVINADTSEITDFSELFFDKDGFNLPIGSWDVGNVTTMKDMFLGESFSSFNQDISNWDVSSVIDFESAFNGCYILNQDFSNWNTGSATNMTSMFNWCRPLDTDLSGWNVDNVVEYENFRKDTSITDAHTPPKFR